MWATVVVDRSMSTQHSQDLSYRFIIVVHVERRVISRNRMCFELGPFMDC